MECTKCKGLMINQAFSNKFLSVEGWKCLNCGKIVERKENTIKDSAFGLFYQKEKLKNQS